MVICFKNAKEKQVLAWFIRTVYGVGQGQPIVYKAAIEPRSDGVVVQGIGGGSKDTPYMRQGHWRWCEMELHNTAWFAQVIFELLPPTGDQTP